MQILVALYRAMRLRFGYGFESCDANGPRNVKNTNIAKHRPIFLPPLLLVGSKELVLKVPKTSAISRCDSRDKKTLRFVCPSCTRDTDSIAAKLLRCGIASEALWRNMPLRCRSRCEQHLPWTVKGHKSQQTTVNILKTTPTPNKNGSYGVKVGVRMP